LRVVQRRPPSTVAHTCVPFKVTARGAGFVRREPMALLVVSVRRQREHERARERLLPATGKTVSVLDLSNCVAALSGGWTVRTRTIRRSRRRTKVLSKRWSDRATVATITAMVTSMRPHSVVSRSARGDAAAQTTVVANRARPEAVESMRAVCWGAANATCWPVEPTAALRASSAGTKRVASRFVAVGSVGRIQCAVARAVAVPGASVAMPAAAVVHPGLCPSEGPGSMLPWDWH